jgi:hypothetical protein
MRKYDSKAGSAARTEFGVDLAEGLKAFPETAALAEPLEALTEQLNATYEARRAKLKALARIRATLRVTEYRAEQELRTFARAVEVVDGGRYGRLYEEIFPHGLVAAIEPRRSRQVRTIRAIVDTLTRSAVRDGSALRTQWLPRLQRVHDELQAAVTAHDTGAAEADAAFREELRLRAAHELAVDQIVGQVRAVFPKNAARQNAVFPARPARQTRVEPPTPPSPPDVRAPVTTNPG